MTQKQAELLEHWKTIAPEYVKKLENEGKLAFALAETERKISAGIPTIKGLKTQTEFAGLSV